jgi:hypothetical protein
VALDQPRGLLGIAGGQCVPHRVLDQPVLLEPRGGGLVQAGDLVGMSLHEARLQQVGEQVVVAPPAPDVVEREQEEVGPLDLLQQRLTVHAAGDRVAQ